MAFVGTVEPQTSTTHERPEGTYPELHDADSEEKESVPNRQEADKSNVPFATDLETRADCPLARAGTKYPDAVVAEHPGAEPVMAPSMSAPVEDGFARSFTSPATEPDAPTG